MKPRLQKWGALKFAGEQSRKAEGMIPDSGLAESVSKACFDVYASDSYKGTPKGLLPTIKYISRVINTVIPANTLLRYASRYLEITENTGFTLIT